MLKKPKDFYEDADKFVGVLISTTENKVISTVDYAKLLKSIEKYQIDETKDEILVRELTNQEVTDLAK